MARSTHLDCETVFENADFIVSVNGRGCLVITREFRTKTGNGPFLTISPHPDDVHQDHEGVQVIRPAHFKAVLLYSV